MRGEKREHPPGYPPRRACPFRRQRILHHHHQSHFPKSENRRGHIIQLFSNERRSCALLLRAGTFWRLRLVSPRQARAERSLARKTLRNHSSIFGKTQPVRRIYRRSLPARAPALIETQSLEPAIAGAQSPLFAVYSRNSSRR